MRHETLLLLLLPNALAWVAMLIVRKLGASLVIEGKPIRVSYILAAPVLLFNASTFLNVLEMPTWATVALCLTSAYAAISLASFMLWALVGTMPRAALDNITHQRVVYLNLSAVVITLLALWVWYYRMSVGTVMSASSYVVPLMALGLSCTVLAQSKL